MSNDVEYRPTNVLGVVLPACLGLYLFLGLVGMWSDWLEIELLRRAAAGAEVTEAEALANDSRQQLVAILQIVVLIVTAIVFFRWTYVVGRNTLALGARDLKISPGWSVGYYFVPIVNLWRPFQAMQQNFRASHPDYGENWSQAPAPALVPVWWALWIGAGVVGQISLRVAASADTIDEAMVSSWLIFASDCLDIPLSAVVIAMVFKLRGLQDAKHEKVSSVDHRLKMSAPVPKTQP